MERLIKPGANDKHVSGANSYLPVQTDEEEYIMLRVKRGQAFSKTRAILQSLCQLQDRRSNLS